MRLDDDELIEQLERSNRRLKMTIGLLVAVLVAVVGGSVALLFVERERHHAQERSLLVQSERLKAEAEARRKAQQQAPIVQLPDGGIDSKQAEQVLKEYGGLMKDLLRDVNDGRIAPDATPAQPPQQQPQP